jgi:hypothetical protein
MNFCGEGSKPLDITLGLPCTALFATRWPIDPVY